MKTQILNFACLSVVSVACAAAFAASAASDANPYRSIVQKNSFRLLPPIELPTEPPRQPPVKTWLQGITTVLGSPLALMKLSSPVNGPEVSVILGEGERLACVEVIEIDQTARTVRLLNYGALQEFSLNADARQSDEQIISVRRPYVLFKVNPEP